MARYKAKEKIYLVDRLINVGQEFESDLPPGKAWEPLDADARAKVGPRQNYNRSGQVIPLTPDEQALADEEVANAKRGVRGRKGRKGRRNAKAEAAAEAASRAPKVNTRGHKMASPGKSVTQQQTDGEEPTVGAIHDNEEV